MSTMTRKANEVKFDYTLDNGLKIQTSRIFKRRIETDEQFLSRIGGMLGCEKSSLEQGMKGHLNAGKDEYHSGPQLNCRLCKRRSVSATSNQPLSDRMIHGKGVVTDFHEDHGEKCSDAYFLTVAMESGDPLGFAISRCKQDTIKGSPSIHVEVLTDRSELVFESTPLKKPVSDRALKTNDTHKKDHAKESNNRLVSVDQYLGKIPESKDETCPWWSQQPSDVEKGHIHVCSSPVNASKRCGYEKDDWEKCPYYNQEKGETQ